jgi:hypothetical protein
MYKKIENDLFTVVIDPTDHWPKLKPADMFDTLGPYIKEWLIMYTQPHEADDHTTLQEHMAECYRFGLHPMTGGTVGEDLIYQYPEDPPLYPILQWVDTRTGAEFVFYQHAICAMRQAPEDEWFITRMD